MKIALFIIAISISGFTYAQAPQITPAQLENSRVIAQKVHTFNTIVDQQVDQIMTLGTVATNKKGELQELVAFKLSQTASINDDTLTDAVKQAQIAAVNNEFNSQLQKFLGVDKFNLVSSALNSN